MRGADALPGSKTTSRRKGSRRNLGDLAWPAVAAATPGRDRKSRRRSCRGAGEESDEPIAPMKRSNKPVTNGGGERGGKGLSRREDRRQRMPRTLCRPQHVTGVGCLRIGPAWAAKPRTPVTLDLRQEPGAGKPHAGICAGGGEQSPSLPLPPSARNDGSVPRTPGLTPSPLSGADKDLPASRHRAGSVPLPSWATSRSCMSVAWSSSSARTCSSMRRVVGSLSPK
jgi:hypothetical protein